jgi:hypothetical protein
MQSAFEGGSFTDTECTASGPDSGTVSLDGKVIRYFGLEPVANTGTATNARLCAPRAQPRG